MFDKFYKHIMEPEKYGSICAAINCRRDKNVNPRGFFQFPSTEERCKQWVIRCRRLDLYGVPPFILAKYYSLCKKHFDLTYFEGDITKITNSDDLPYPTLFDFPFIRYSVPLQDPISKKIKDRDFERKIFPGGVNFKSINRVVIMNDDKMFLCGGPLLRPKNMFCCPETKILQYSPKEMFLFETSYYCLALVGEIKMTDRDFGYLEAIGLFNICEAFVTYRTVAQMVNDYSMPVINLERIEGVHKEFIGDIKCKYMGKDSVKIAQEAGNIIKKHLANHKFRKRTIPSILKNSNTTRALTDKTLHLNQPNNNLPETCSVVLPSEEPISNKSKPCEQIRNVGDNVVSTLKKIGDPHKTNGVSQFAVLIDLSKQDRKDQVTLAPMEFFKLPKLNLDPDEDESRRKLYQIDISKMSSEDALPYSQVAPANYGLQQLAHTLHQTQNKEHQINSVSHSKNKGSNIGDSNSETMMSDALPCSINTVPLSNCQVTQANCKIQQLAKTSAGSKSVVHQASSVSQSQNMGPEFKEKEQQHKQILHKSSDGDPHPKAMLSHSNSTVSQSKCHVAPSNSDNQQLANTSSQSKSVLLRESELKKREHQVAMTSTSSKSVVSRASSLSHSQNMGPESKEREHQHKHILHELKYGDSDSETILPHALPCSSSTVSLTQENCDNQQLANISSQSKSELHRNSEFKEREHQHENILYTINDHDCYSAPKLPYWSNNTSSLAKEASAKNNYSLFYNDSINCFNKARKIQEATNHRSDNEVLATEANNVFLYSGSTYILTRKEQPLTYGKASSTGSKQVDKFKNKCFVNNEPAEQLGNACSEQISFTSEYTMKSNNQIPQVLEVDMDNSIDLTSIENIHFRPTSEIVTHQPTIIKHPLYKTGSSEGNYYDSEYDQGSTNDEEDESTPVELVKVPYAMSSRQEKFMLLSQESKRPRSNCSTYDSDKEIISDNECNTYKRSRLMTLNGLYKDAISKVPINDKFKFTLKDVFEQSCNRDAAQLKAKRSLIKIPVGSKKTVPITKEYVSNLLTQALIVPSLKNSNNKTEYEMEGCQHDSTVEGNEVVIDEDLNQQQEQASANIQPPPIHKKKKKPCVKRSNKKLKKMSHDSTDPVKPSLNQKSPNKPTNDHSENNSNVSIHHDTVPSSHGPLLMPPSISNQNSQNKYFNMRSKSIIECKGLFPQYIEKAIRNIFTNENVIVHKVSASENKSTADLDVDIFDKPLFDLAPEEVILSSDLSLKLTTVPADHEGIPQGVKDIMRESDKKICTLLRIKEFHPSKKESNRVNRVAESIDYDTRQILSLKPQLKIQVNSDCGLITDLDRNEDVKSFTFNVEKQYRSYCVPEPVSPSLQTNNNSVFNDVTEVSASIAPINPSSLKTYQKRHTSQALIDICGVILPDDSQNIHQDPVKGESGNRKHAEENLSSKISDPPTNPILADNTNEFTPSYPDNINISSTVSSNDFSPSPIVLPKIATISMGPNSQPQIKIIDFKSNYIPNPKGLDSKFDMTLPPPEPVRKYIELRPPTPKHHKKSKKPECYCGGMPIPSDLSWYLNKTRFDRVPEPYKELAKQFLALKVENRKLKRRYYRCKSDKERMKKRHRPVKLKDLMMEMKKYLTPEAYEFLKSTINLRTHKCKGFRYSDELKRICCKLVLSGGWKSYLYLASFFALPNRRTVLRFIYHQIEVVRSAKQIQEGIDSISLPSTSAGFQDTNLETETSSAVQAIIPADSSPLQNSVLEEIIPPILDSSVAQTVEDAKTELFYANDILSFGHLENILKAEEGPPNLRGCVPPPRVRAKSKPRDNPKSSKGSKRTKKSEVETELSHNESGVRVHCNLNQNKNRKVKNSVKKKVQSDVVASDDACERNFQDVFHDWMYNLSMATDLNEAGPSGYSSDKQQQKQTSVRSRKSSFPTKRLQSPKGKTKSDYEYHNNFPNAVEDIVYYNPVGDGEQCYEEIVDSTNN